MASQPHTKSSDVSNTGAYHPTRPRQRAGLGISLILLLLLVALIGAIFEYFGVINLIPDFGRRGRPTIDLGTWQPNELTDLPEEYWANSYIEDLAQQGIVGGFPDNTFRPNQPVSRAEFAAMLQAAFNENPTPRIARSLQAMINSESTALTGGFIDVSPDFWAGPAIADMTKAGFFTGFPNQRFYPNQAVSRANAIAAIANGLNIDRDAATRDSLWFYRDAAQIPEYAKDSIAAATEAGIQLYQSNPPLLRPKQNLTRAEAAVLIHQAIEQAQQ